MSSDTTFSIFIAGEPAPQGSKSYKGRSKSGKAILIESSKKVHPWREDIRAACLGNDGKPRVQFGDSPTITDLEFILPRPKSTPKKKTPCAIRKPDLDKLVRAVFDALKSAGIWGDDARCVGVRATKRLADVDEAPGCHLEIKTASPDVPLHLCI